MTVEGGGIPRHNCVSEEAKRGPRNACGALFGAIWAPMCGKTERPRPRLGVKKRENFPDSKIFVAKAF